MCSEKPNTFLRSLLMSIWGYNAVNQDKGLTDFIQWLGIVSITNIPYIIILKIRLLEELGALLGARGGMIFSKGGFTHPPLLLSKKVQPIANNILTTHLYNQLYSKASHPSQASRVLCDIVQLSYARIWRYYLRKAMHFREKKAEAVERSTQRNFPLSDPTEGKYSKITQ